MQLNCGQGEATELFRWSKVFVIFSVILTVTGVVMSRAFFASAEAGHKPSQPSQTSRSSQPSKSSRPSNVVLITIDTLRADHLGCYGYAGVKTPNIDALARQGVLFQHAYTAVPVTFPSHVSILTGTYPPFHGVRNNGNFTLDESVVTLPEVLAGHGYRTAAFIGAAVLDSYYGLNQGFQDYDDDFSEGAPNEDQLFQEKTAEQVTRAAVKWLEKNGKSRFFIWLHYFDPHAVYNAPPPFSEEKNPYDGEIAYTDHWLGELFRKLKEDLLTDKTMIILTSDHGESLGEHREATHGVFIYDSTLRVPLIIKSSLLPSPKAVSELVRSVDIAPTILQTLGIDYDGPMHGKSLLNLVHGQKEGEERVLYCESYLPYYNHGWSSLTGLRTGGWKYINAPEPELYDLSEDQGEERNLIKEKGDIRAKMEKKLQTLLSSITPLKSEKAAEVLPDQDRLDRLMNLGYIRTASSKKSSGPLADPKKKIGLLDYLDRGMGFLMAGDPNGAISEFASLVKKDPGNIFAHLILGSTYSNKKLYDQSLKEFQEVAKIDDTYMDIHSRLASVYQIKGLSDRAIGEYRLAIRNYPKCAENYNFLASIYIELGLYDEAVEQLKKSVKLKPNFIRAHNNLGLAYGKKKSYALAIEEFKEALKEKPSIAEIYNNMGCVYLEVGILLKQKKIIPQFPVTPQEMEKIYTQIPKLKDQPATAFDLAREAFEEALRVDAQYKEARINLGVTYLNAGLTEKAAAEYQKMLTEDSSDIQARLNLAVVYLQNGSFEKGIKNFQEVIGLDPDNMLAHYYLGSVYLKRGQAEKAMAEYLRMVEIQPKNPDAHFYLGEAYRANGQTRQAIEEYQKALENNPDHRRARQSLSLLTSSENVER